MPSPIYRIVTDSASEFTGAIAQNAMETEAFAIPQAGLVGMNGQVELTAVGLAIVSKENLSWELNFWADSNFDEATPNADKYLGRYGFVAGDGVQVAGAGLWRYYIDGLELPLWDLDKDGKLFLGLVNRSAAAKTAGVNGAVNVTIFVKEMQAGY